jgi:hypothetical protein
VCDTGKAALRQKHEAPAPPGLLTDAQFAIPCVGPQVDFPDDGRRYTALTVLPRNPRDPNDLRASISSPSLRPRPSLPLALAPLKSPKIALPTGAPNLQELLVLRVPYRNIRPTQSQVLTRRRSRRSSTGFHVFFSQGFDVAYRKQSRRPFILPPFSTNNPIFCPTYRDRPDIATGRTKANGDCCKRRIIVDGSVTIRYSSRYAYFSGREESIASATVCCRVNSVCDELSTSHHHHL